MSRQVEQPLESKKSKLKPFTNEQPKLNPFLNEVPDFFQRFRHGSHKHRLFAVFGNDNRVCDNSNCEIRISSQDTHFMCPRCDFDLCQKCFRLDSSTHTPLADDDDEIDDRIFTVGLLVDTRETVGKVAPQYANNYEDYED